ncbi:MAG TPA: hypothetical protein VEC36_02850 [Patescibacteria group bacterium]|nr:hypothetical protein [Patescibacteria group bacterium]
MQIRIILSIFVAVLMAACESRTGEKLIANSGPADTLVVGDGTAESVSEKRNSATTKLKPVVPEKEKTFADFPAIETASGKPVKPNFATHPPLSKYKTVLTRGTARGANFAGKYAFVTWGCGTGCQQSAIVDVTNGTIFPGKEARGGYKFTKESRFLIVNPRDSVAVDANMPKPEYYVFENGNLTPIEP